MKKTILKAVICCLLFAITVVAQNGINEKLKEKYKVVDGNAYLMRPGIAVIINVSQQDKIVSLKCKTQATSTEPSKLNVAMIRDIVDELVPVNERGQYTDNNTDVDNQTTLKYQNLTIKAMFDNSQTNNLQDATVYFLWKN